MGGTLLLRGMLVGIVAGILCFGFLKVFGEPPVDCAIAFESQIGGTAPPGEPELVSRKVQAGLGLFTGVAVYSAAFGGLFALAFAFAYGRIGTAGPRAVSAVLAGCGFLSVYLVPTLKYPANPPSIGELDTIGLRTALYFGIILLSLAAMIGAGMIRRNLLRRLGPWDATVAVGIAYVAVMAVFMLVMPPVSEVPDEFPALVLWQFRLASIGGQAIMWSVIGLGFGALTERAAAHGRLVRFKASV